MKTTCQYIVKEFKKEHNHHLVPPQQVNLIRAFRGVDDVTKIQATYHPHVDVDKLDDDTLVVTCFIAHIGFDCSEVLNNFIFCLLLYWLIAENQATNGCIGRDRDCHRRLAYGITHLKVVRTPYYMCPELLANIPNGFISHIWSFGMPLSFAIYIKLGAKFLSNENMVLQSNVEDISAARASVDRELIEKKSLLELGNILGHLNELVESLKSNLDKVRCERDHLQKEIMILEGKVETAYALANENAAITAEAQEIAESRRVYAEEKEEEVKLLEESVQELDSTISVFEDKVDILKGEAERQRLQREELELELHALNHKMQNVESTGADVERFHLDEKARNLQEALKRIKILEKDLANKDTEIAQCKAHILELTVHAEAEASEYKHKDSFFIFDFAEVKAEEASSHERISANKLEKNASKGRGSASSLKAKQSGSGCENLRQQLNEFIKERQGKHRQQERLLGTKNEALKIELTNHKKKVAELEGEVKKLSGQQNVHQRIYHHAKIKANAQPGTLTHRQKALFG
ncbi:hypothetical protein Cgig2_032302 [Carnegiea gigantea]|uniref:Uncharacterized protein n=1 Tax=Carnegiea gigantea TaxID=171969 RepID=A0A9Q1JUV9_9CARY|nr:hypothetical protein Cgig2_032302 [Carnegiea gigantea]